MKRIVAYMLLVAILTASLAACNGTMNSGSKQEDREMSNAEQRAEDAGQNAKERVENGAKDAKERLEEGEERLMSPRPDVKNGLVRDDDGIITEEDNERAEAPATAAPNTKKP